MQTAEVEPVTEILRKKRWVKGKEGRTLRLPADLWEKIDEFALRHGYRQPDDDDEKRGYRDVCEEFLTWAVTEQEKSDASREPAAPKKK